MTGDVAAWFYWLPGPRGPGARLAFSVLSGEDRSRALAIHPLTDQDREAVRAAAGDWHTVLSARYPAPVKEPGPVKGMPAL